MAQVRFKGTLRSTDASSGEALTLFEPGSADAIEINSNDQIVVEKISISSAAATQVELYFGSSAGAPIDANSIVRVAAAANSSYSPVLDGIVGQAGFSLFGHTGAAGVVSITATGRVVKRDA